MPLAHVPSPLPTCLYCKQDRQLLPGRGPMSVTKSRPQSRRATDIYTRNMCTLVTLSWPRRTMSQHQANEMWELVTRAFPHQHCLMWHWNISTWDADLNNLKVLETGKVITYKLLMQLFSRVWGSEGHLLSANLPKGNYRPCFPETRTLIMTPVGRKAVRLQWFSSITWEPVKYANSHSPPRPMESELETLGRVPAVCV